jgi:flagellar biosynthetic protein FliR
MTPDSLGDWLMVFLRASGLLAVFPVFSAPSMPVRARVALGALMAFLITPGLPESSWLANQFSGLIGQMAMEVGVGLVFGFICKMIFFAVETAGGIISAEIGLNLPPIFNPMSPSPTALPGTLLSYLATVLWLSLDLHHWLLLGFGRSFEILPMGGAHLTEPVLGEVLRWTSLVFVIALQMAAPVMAVSFIISLVFSILGRAVAQMNVFTESFAIRLFAGLTVFGISSQLMAQHIANYLGRLPEDMLRVAQYLGS